MSEEGATVGYPTKYRPEYADEVERVCKLGATDTYIAEYFRVTRQTIWNWKNRYPEFAEAVHRGKLVADIQVAESLFNQALKGDVKACTLWLANRHPELWNVKRQVVLSGDDASPIRLRVGRMDDEELVQKGAEIINRLKAVKGNGSNG